MSKKKILINAFNMNCIGHINHGLWTHPRDNSTTFNTLEYWTELAQLLERGLFDGLFIADIVAAMRICFSDQRSDHARGKAVLATTPIPSELACIGQHKSAILANSDLRV